MNNIHKSFLENENYLKNNFDFERLSKQLKYISQFPEQLPYNQKMNLIKKAKMIRHRIFLKGWTDSRLKNSILHIQAREVIDQYKSNSFQKS